MEHKIGEIVTLPDGRKMKVVEREHDTCNGCLFAREEEKYDCYDIVGLYCAGLHRSDHKNIIYKEVE